MPSYKEKSEMAFMKCGEQDPFCVICFNLRKLS